MLMSEDVLPNNLNIKTSDLEALHDDAWRWAYSLVSDRCTADDVMQRVYVEIVAGSARYDAQSSLKTWLFGVVRNIAYGHFRAEKRNVRLLTRLKTLATNDRATITEPTTEVGSALSDLPARQREVLELVVYREFTLEECAKIMGIGIGAVRTHYHRGKTTLRARLEDVNES